MRILITGGCGFLGSNLAQTCFENGNDVTVIDNLSRSGTDKNCEWLKTLAQEKKVKFNFVKSDTKDFSPISEIVKELKPIIIFHLAGQVAMTTSLENPRRDFDTNVVGGFNILESVRQFSPESIILYSSTNKVYGDLEHVSIEEAETRYVTPKFPKGFDEKIGLDFQSPYGCSKGATDQYMLDYARLFKLKTVVFRHSTIFGGRQFATFDQGWVGWFTQQAIKTKKGLLKEPFTIAGTGKQVRDILFISDLIDCYFKAVNSISKTAGQAYNIGGGMENSLSLLELFQILESQLSVKLNFTKLDWRASDQRVFVADTSKAIRDFGFQVNTNKVEGIRKMISWIETLEKQNAN